MLHHASDKATLAQRTDQAFRAADPGRAAGHLIHILDVQGIPRCFGPWDRAMLKGVDSMAWHWLYASNVGVAIKGSWLASPTWLGLGHFWSLAVEEQFYLVWPLLVFLMPIRRTKQVCAILVLISPLVALGLYFWLGSLGAYVSTLGRVGVLAAGGWLAVVRRSPQDWQGLVPKLTPVAVVTAVVLLLERTYLPVLASLESSLALVLGGAVVGLAASGMGGRSRRFLLESPFLRWLGKYSYGIYVYHHALKPVWMYFIWERQIVPHLGSGWPATLCYTATASIASLSLAWLSWVCIEAPLLSLKSRWSYRTPRDPEVIPGRVS